VVWGAEPPRERSFRNEDCWAQRRGRLHLVPDMQTGLLCRHTRARATPHGSLCLPLLVHGESLGIFQLLPRRREGTENWENRLEERRQLAVNAANSISLALINLQFRERMTDLTVRDHFTGLFNRRSLEGTLPREMSRCENRGRPLGIIMFAIDNFARFNQAYGYEVGDAVLRELGALLERNIRTHGRAYRYSGAKFVLVLPEVAAAAALGQAEFFRQEIKKLLSHNGRDFPPPLTMSGGVVVFPDHGATANDLLKGAELALARAKQEGPDRLFLAPAGGRTA